MKKKEKNPENDPLPGQKDKLYKTKNNNRLVDKLSLDDMLFRCGELQLDIIDTCNLCASHIDTLRLKHELNDPNSTYYTTYMQGVSEGKLKLNIDLEYNISEPKVRDAYKSLTSERRREAINRKLEELF